MATDIILGDTMEIAGMTYTIVQGVTITEQLREDGDAGQCDYRRLQIKIAHTDSPERRQYTILHELLHAICWENNRDGELKETQINGIAQGLCQVFKQLGIRLNTKGS